MVKRLDYGPWGSTRALKTRCCKGNSVTSDSVTARLADTTDLVQKSIGSYRATIGGRWESEMTAIAERPHVVIAGAGFAGLYAARSLRTAPVRVTIVEAERFDLPEKFCIGLSALQPCNRDTRHMDTDRYRLVHKILSSKDSTNLTRSILNETIFESPQHLIKRPK